MEKIASDLKLAETQQSNLAGAYEALHSQASSFLDLGVRWQDLEDHLDSTRSELQTRFDELCVREGGHAAAERREIESRKSHLEALKVLIGEAEEELAVRERRFAEVGGLIIDKEREIREKTKALGVLDKCGRDIKIREKKLSEVKAEIDKCNSKPGDNFKVVVREMEEWCRVVEVKEREVEGWMGKIEAREKEFEARVEEVDAISKRIDECVSEGQVKLEKHFLALENVRQENVKRFEALEKAAVERARELEMKQKKLEHKAIELDLKQQQMKMKGKCTSIVHSTVKVEPAFTCILPSSGSIEFHRYRNGRGLQLIMSEHLKRIDLMGREMSAILRASSDAAALVLDAMQGFYPTDSAMENGELESNLKIIRRSCILLLQELKMVSPQISEEVREKAMNLAADWKVNMAKVTENRLEVLGFLRLVSAYQLTSMYDVKELQSLLTKVVQSDEATGLVQDLGITDKAHVSSTMSSPVRIEEPASSVAKSGAAIAFPTLQPSATRDEIYATLQTSADPAQLVLDTMQTSFAQCWKNGDVCLEPTVMMGSVYLLEKLPKVLIQVGPHTKLEARKLAVEWKLRMRADAGNPLEILLFLQFITTYGLLSILNGSDIVILLGVISQHKQAVELCQALGFTDKIPDFIRNLIERKQLNDAVRFICIFKLTDKFPLVKLLKDYVENARKQAIEVCKNQLSVHETVKIVDSLINDLTAVKQCIRDYNLEPEYPSAYIEMQVIQLTRLKGNFRHEAPPVASRIDDAQDQRKRKRPSTSAFAPIMQPPQQHEQFHQQTAVSTVRHYAFPTPTSIYPQSSSISSLMYANYGVPGHFGMAANDYANGALNEGHLLLTSDGQSLFNPGTPLPAVHIADQNHPPVVNLDFIENHKVSE